MVELTGNFVGSAATSGWKRCHLYVGEAGIVHGRISCIGENGKDSVLRILTVKNDASKLLAKTLKLPAEARAAVAGSLIENLDETIDEDAEAAWAGEISRRIRELDSGRAKTLPWS